MRRAAFQSPALRDRLRAVVVVQPAAERGTLPIGGRLRTCGRFARIKAGDVKNPADHEKPTEPFVEKLCETEFQMKEYQGPRECRQDKGAYRQGGRPSPHTSAFDHRVLRFLRIWHLCPGRHKAIPMPAPQNTYVTDTNAICPSSVRDERPTEADIVEIERDISTRMTRGKGESTRPVAGASPCRFPIPQR